LKDYHESQSENNRWLKNVTLASFEAGVICTILTQPAWIIKTRMLLNTE
jgi:hypothetical protein